MRNALRDPAYWVAAAVYVLLIACWAWLAAAPVPPHRPKAPRQLPPGSWEVTWGGSSYGTLTGKAVMHKDGSWRCRWHSHGSEWVGFWHWDPATRLLRVTEWPASDQAPCPTEWEALLDGELSGEGSWDRGRPQDYPKGHPDRMPIKVTARPRPDDPLPANHPPGAPPAGVT